MRGVAPRRPGGEPMTDQKVLSLALFGFSEHERRVLGSMLKLAAARGRRYLVSEGGERERADIGIVNGDQPQAVAEWRRCRAGGERMPSVVVGVNPSAEDGAVAVTRPFSVRRLLEALDRVTITNLRYVPELTIADRTEGAGMAESVMVQATEAARSAKRSGSRALVVDDSPPVRKLMEIQLGLYGIDVAFATTGEEALQSLDERHFDIVFLDVMLPGMDGYMVCKALRRNRGLRDIPVVMLTGRGSRIDRIRGAMAGCSMYLTKPVAQEALQDVIRRYLPTEESHAHQ